jgi:hypothetical protein
MIQTRCSNATARFGDSCAGPQGGLRSLESCALLSPEITFIIITHHELLSVLFSLPTTKLAKLIFIRRHTVLLFFLLIIVRWRGCCCGGGSSSCPATSTEKNDQAAATASSCPASSSSNSLRNSAFVFVKPSANTKATQALVRETLQKAGCTIRSEQSITGQTIDQNQLIDQHYYAIASKATLFTPKDIPVPVDKFQQYFHESWETVLREDRTCNALDACICRCPMPI